MSSSATLNDDPSTTGLQSDSLTTEAIRLSAVITMEPEAKFSHASTSDALITIAQTTENMIAEESPQKEVSQKLGTIVFL